MIEFNVRPIEEKDDVAIAKIIRDNLKKFKLDIPGTAYFDPELDYLSAYYSEAPDKRAYFIVEDEESKVQGGIGLAAFSGFENCAELQKLYLADEVKGQGISKKLLAKIEETAKAMGFKMIYLETHTNLDVALKLYEKSGYELIDKPNCVFHSTMNRFYVKHFKI